MCITYLPIDRRGGEYGMATGSHSLLTEVETDYPHFDTCCNILTAIPPVIEEELPYLIPWLFFLLILLQCSLAPELSANYCCGNSHVQ